MGKVTLAQVQKEFQKKSKDIETIKKLLVEFAEQNLTPNERRKIHARVKNVKAKKDLEEAIDLAEKYAEQHDKRASGKKKQNKNTTPPEPLSEKDLKYLEELREKTRQKIIFGDIKRPTEYDKYIVQKIDIDDKDSTEVFKKSQFAYLLRESVYIGKHLERLVEEKIGGLIAEWYKHAPFAFTSRLKPIQDIYKDVEGVLTCRLFNLKGDFQTGYRKLFAVAKQCDKDKDRDKWFEFLPKPITDFKLAAKEFYETIIYAIHTEARIALNELTKPTSGNAGETQNNNLLTGEAKALAMLVEHSDWTDTKIAKAVGVSRTTLYNWSSFKKAKEALKQGRNKFPSGSKNGESGDIEAW